LTIESRKFLTITDKKQNELIAEKNEAKLQIKELKTALAKTEKFNENLLEECSDLKELLRVTELGQVGNSTLNYNKDVLNSGNEVLPGSDAHN
jgi:IS4 transposase